MSHIVSRTLRAHLCILWVAITSIILVGTQTARAEYADPARKGKFQPSLGIGFAASIGNEEAFLLGLEFGYFVHQNVVIMPRIAFGLDDSYQLYLFMVDARYVFDISHPKLTHLKPFVGLGVGAAVLHFDVPDRVGTFSVDNTDAAFTFEIPVGFDYTLPKNFSVGTEMQFTIPISLYDDNFLFQWQVVTARYLF